VVAVVAVFAEVAVVAMVAVVVLLVVHIARTAASSAVLRLQVVDTADLDGSSWVQHLFEATGSIVLNW